MRLPLVTIGCFTYNQQDYVRETVRGLLSQTYEPLEIVISDDHSTDRTWEIINEEVDAYRKSGGIHKNIVLNRNERNLGIALNAQKKISLSHGELLIENGGDDISLPNRVKRIVDIWMESGKRYDAIYSGAVKIDSDGLCVGELPERYFSRSCLGAVAAYSRKLIDSFPPISVRGAAEDAVYAKRTDMLGGGRFFLRENLVKYRVGSGVSTAVRNWRKPNLRAFEMNCKSAEQGLLDLQWAEDKCMLKNPDELRSELIRVIAESSAHITLLEGDRFWDRAAAYRMVHYRPWFRIGGWFQLLCLLPKKYGDPALNFLLKIRAVFNR